MPEASGSVKQDLDDVEIVAGRFAVELDFGAAAFDNSGRWLVIEVQGVTLAPRVTITRAPYSLQTRGIFVDSDGEIGIGTTAPDADIHLAGSQPTLRLDHSAAADAYSELIDATSSQLRINKNNGSGSVFLDLNPMANDGTSNALVRFFRETDTTGTKGLRLYRGNNSTELSGVIGVDGANSYLQAHEGNLGVGVTNPEAKLDVLGRTEIAIQAFSIDNHGVSARARRVGMAGVFGLYSALSGVGYGVVGHANSTTGFDFYATGAGGNYGSTSSRRWKHNIENIADPLAKLARLRGVTFVWDAEHGGHHDIGMIAEEVGSVLPEIVVYEDNGVDAQGMDYSKLTPLLVEAVNELRTQMDAHIASLQAVNQTLRNRLEELQTVRGSSASDRQQENIR